MQNNDPIDVVISWVDGNDPVHKLKIKPYLNKQAQISEDIAGPTRFRSEGEIFYCVSSILIFAPFIRKIFIITDNQNPQFDNFIRKNFPESTIPVVIVDHSEIFKGYEEHLPVFNSISIETCIFKTPDLCENFVYFNDDFFLTRPIKPEDWFIQNKPVAYGYWRSILLDRTLSFIKPRKNGYKPFGYKDSILNAAKCIGQKGKYFYMTHSPQAMKKSLLEEYFAENPDKIIANISHKFREKTQFNPQALFYLLAFKTNNCIQNSEMKTLFMKPVRCNTSYVDRKMKVLENNSDILFCCIESIDMAEKADQQKIFNWLGELLNITTIGL